MKFIAIFVATVVASISYATSPLDVRVMLNGNCAKFLQAVHGAKDNPSSEYSLTIEQGTNITEKIPTYHLRVNGLPAGRKFKIVNRNALGSELVLFEGVHLGEGKMLLKDEQPTTCRWFVVGGFARGEPSQLLIVDSETNATNSVFYLPYPHEPAVFDDLKISRYLVSSSPMAYFFDMENLISEKMVHLLVKSGETLEGLPFNAPTTRMAGALVFRDDSANSEEEGFFSVHQSGDNGPAITFPWKKDTNILPAAVVLFTIDHSPASKEIQSVRQQYFNIPVEAREMITKCNTERSMQQQER